VVVPLQAIDPYPSLVMAPIHNQQPLIGSGDMRDENRSSISVLTMRPSIADGLTFPD
jgi:hypothetical protein